jgi:hypothetical protein
VWEVFSEFDSVLSNCANAPYDFEIGSATVAVAPQRSQHHPSPGRSNTALLHCEACVTVTDCVFVPNRIDAFLAR